MIIDVHKSHGSHLPEYDHGHNVRLERNPHPTLPVVNRGSARGGQGPCGTQTKDQNPQSRPRKALKSVFQQLPLRLHLANSAQRLMPSTTLALLRQKAFKPRPRSKRILRRGPSGRSVSPVGKVVHARDIDGCIS